MRYRGALATSVLGLVALVTLSGCATQALVSSWKAPDASPFQLKGEKVAAIVMTTDLPIRRAGEDALARQLSLHGVEGVPMYTLLSDPHPDEAKARAAAEQADIVGVVVIRPVSIDKELSSRPATYSGPMYGGFWGGYYGLGWGSGGEIRTSTIVTVETLVYGLRENKLLWGGQSRTTNPRNLDRLIEDTAQQVAGELVRLGLIPKS
jgi:hypothetical protein